MKHDCSKHGCPQGTDLRTCQTAINGECPFLMTHGGAGLFFQERQQKLFEEE